MPSGPFSIVAEATVAAAPAEVFEVIGDLDRHRELTDGGMRIVALHGPVGRRTGGLVELRGPAGVTRLARTRVHGAELHTRLWGSAETRDGARALLEWHIRPHREGARVDVRLDVSATGWRDRLLLRLGGRTWLRARLRSALERLGQEATRSGPPEISAFRSRAGWRRGLGSRRRPCRGLSR